MLSSISGLKKPFPYPTQHLRVIATTLGAIISVQVAFGAYDSDFYRVFHSFHQDHLNVLNVVPTFSKAIFLTLKVLTVISALLLVFLPKKTIPLWSSTVLFFLVNGLSSKYAGGWSYITFLHFIQILLCFVDIDKINAPSRSAVTVLFCLKLVILSVYLQAFTSKFVVSGWPWFVSGKTIAFYSFLLGGNLGKWLHGYQELLPVLGCLTFIVEGILPFGLLIPRYSRWSACLLICFHLAVYVVFNISFWQIIIVLLALFVYEGRTQLAEKPSLGKL
jgi:hypothetical protein